MISYDNSITSKIVSTGSAPGKLYGTIKVHKQGNPARPVVSMIDTPEYNLAKFLDQIIKPYIPNQFMLDSTFHLLDKLKEFSPSPHQIMVSFDVVSLFTNVPLEETINMIGNYIYKENNPSPPAFEKDVFVKLMRLATQGLFLYKDTLYKQIDGVTMGCPLGPTLANFFMAHMENQLLCNDQEASPKLYLRYIDDIFAIFDNDQSCTKFLEKLNTQHPNIKFTLEQAKNTIPFLDVEIKINLDKFDTCTWRKPSNTGLLLNFNAFCPKIWKKGLISCLLNRAKITCSTDYLFQKEVTYLKNLFYSNGYPIHFFNKILCQFQKEKTDSKTEKEFINLFIIPYLGKISKEFSLQIQSLIKKRFDIKVTIVYKTTKVQEYFSLKSKTPLALNSNVVYKFTCSRDVNVTYIGTSARHLSIRAGEHLNVSRSSKSAIKEHIKKCSSCKTQPNNMGQFKIIRKCQTSYEAKIHEALVIKRSNPVLNKQLYANGASILLNVF